MDLLLSTVNERQLLIVQAKLMQQRRLKIVWCHHILTADGRTRRSSHKQSAAQSTASQPDTEALTVMIAAASLR